jgi:general secretion pathway protein I
MMAAARPSERGMRGFTLIEVLIALAILAIGLSAAMRASLLTLDSAQTLKERALAGWVADDRLAELTALQAWPGIGVTHGRAAQAGVAFEWDTIVSGTPNPGFRRVEILVYSQDRRHAAARLTGYLLAPALP